MYSSGSKTCIPLLLICIAASPGSAADFSAAQKEAALQPGRIVLKCRDALVPAEIESASLLALLGGQAQGRGLIRLEALGSRSARAGKSAPAITRMGRVFQGHLSAGADRNRLLAWLRRHPLIDYAEPLYYHTLDIVPNDSLYAQQPHLQVVNLPAAWDLIRGEQGDAVIAIVDGGSEIGHQDLRGSLWTNPAEIAGNSRDDDGNGYVDDLHGWNFANSSGDPTGLPSQPAYANHGTHTAGIANAATHNTHGIAGAAWNCRLMAINAADRFGEGIGYGYEAILYAAENGADVINCSWGRTGSASLYEQDVINYATALGSVIVASAGNSGSTTLNFPACYDNVFAVTATNNWDAKASFSTFGEWVDVSAPGVDIMSTVSFNGYSRYSGTSMAAPLAAGVIALVKSMHPDWSGFRCAEQVRAAADPVDDLNPAWAGLIGRGRIDALQAVTAVTPGLRLTAVTFAGEDGDAQFRPGETAQISATLTNYLAPAGPVLLSLSENSTHAALLSSQATLPGLATLAAASPAVPFTVAISPDAPAGHVIPFTLEFSVGEYHDTGHFTLTVAPDFVDLSVNRILTSVTPVGRIGYANPSAAFGGSGFSYKSGANLIYEGSIIAGVSAARISSSARGTSTTPDQDFVMNADGPLTLLRPGPLTAEESTLNLSDRDASLPLEITVRQHTFASDGSGYEDFIIFRYEVTNSGTTGLNGFHFGLFFDWDVDQDHFDGDRAAYDASRRLGYVCNAAGTPGTHVGCALLSPGAVSCRAILNDELAPGNPGWGIYDGFSDAEKWEAISGGTAIVEAGIGDVSQVLSAGPYDIPPHGTITVDFALIAGDDLAAFQQHTDAAIAFRQKYLSAQRDTALLQLNAGWNLVSSPVEPEDTLLKNLLAPIADKLVLFKDGEGKVYWPAYLIDMLTWWDYKKGYWLYITAPAQLLIAGKRVEEEKAEVMLKQGWNTISCLLDRPAAAASVLGGISTELVIAKDGAGRVYWPLYGINTIGELKPGSGYSLFLADPAVIKWP